MDAPLVSLVLILGLGITAQWLAWRLRVPAILLLLSFGIAVGPAAGWVQPDALFGDLLLPMVSLAVGLILFEGGLSLRWSELPHAGSTTWKLVTVGAAVTWGLSTLAARYLAGLELQTAVLLGAVFVVTGPTVIGPLLRQLRLRAPVAPILKWEGILIDPVGAILAVLVFEASVGAPEHSTASGVALSLGRWALAGTAAGLAGAGALVWLLRSYLLPFYLQSPFSLMSVGAVLVIANAVQEESGLLAVSVMGVALAFQTKAPVQGILEFKENLRVLLISTLFIILGARLQPQALLDVALPGMFFVLALVLVIRPASILASTAGSDLTWKDRLMLMAVAPRGIVAAAVASVFAIEFEHAGIPQSELLVPFTFVGIIGTILVYGLGAPIVSRILGAAQSAPHGVLILGSHRGARAIARVLLDSDLRVLLVDSNYMSISKARMEGLEAIHTNSLTEHVVEQLNLDGIGKFFAMTPNDEANSLAALRFVELFGPSEIYQFAPERNRAGYVASGLPSHLRGRILFSETSSYSDLSRRFTGGAEIRRTSITEEFGFSAWRSLYGGDALPLFLVRPGEGLLPYCEGVNQPPKPGDRLVGLIPEDRILKDAGPKDGPATDGGRASGESDGTA